MNDKTRRALIARLVALAAAGYVAPTAVLINPAEADRGRCPPSPMGTGKKCPPHKGVDD